MLPIISPRKSLRQTIEVFPNLLQSDKRLLGVFLVNQAVS